MNESVYRACLALTQSEGFKEVLAALDDDAVNEFKGSAPSDKEGRERAYHKQSALVQIEQQVYSWAAMVS